MAQTITTKFGAIELVDAPASLVPQLQAILPMGALALSGRADGAVAGIAVRCNQENLNMVAFPTARTSGRTDLLSELNGYWIAAVMQDYLRSNYDGLILLGRYIKGATRRSCEVGLACCAFPAPEGLHTHGVLKAPRGGARPSAVTMVTTFAAVFQKFCKETGFAGIRKGQPISYPVHALECLHLDFMVSGPDVVYLRRKIDPLDHVWSVLAHEGVHRVIHLPSVLLKVEPEQLIESTGVASWFNLAPPNG